MVIKKIELTTDILSIVALGVTLLSIFLSTRSTRLSSTEFFLAVSSFIIIIFTYFAIMLIKAANEHVDEINRLNEKINIHKDISDLKARVEFLFNNLNMKKRGSGDLPELLIRIIQIAAILIAGYIILRALGV